MSAEPACLHIHEQEAAEPRLLPALIYEHNHTLKVAPLALMWVENRTGSHLWAAAILIIISHPAPQAL